MNLQNTDSTKHKRGYTVLILAMALAIMLLVGFFSVHNRKTREEKALVTTTSKKSSELPKVNVITVQSSPATISLKLPGETAAWFATAIYARVDGYVNKWSADIGDHVRKGQVLSTIDTPNLDAQLAAAQAKLTASIAQITSREAEVNFAKTTYERWRDSPKGVVSDQEREAKKASYDTAVAQLNVAKAQRGLDQANVDQFKALTQFKQVTAPFDGVITERNIDIGNLITAGSNANTKYLYKMEQNNPIRVFVNVPQSAASDMKVGMQAQIRASNILDRVFEGKIARTSEALNPQSRTLQVEVDIPNADLSLVPGMYVDVSFQVPTAGLLQVPAAALTFRSSGPQVAVIDENNKVHFHNVTIARDNGGTVEIGSGVALGNKVALNISSQISEDEKVDAVDTGEKSADVPEQKS